MANYGPYYGSFGGAYSNVYSQVSIDDWNYTATQARFWCNGGFSANYNWNINNVSGQLYIDNGGWYAWSGASVSGKSIVTGQGGGSDWWLRNYGTFDREATDYYVRLRCKLSFSGNEANADTEYLLVPHLAAVPTGLSATRASDNRVNLSWTLPSTSLDSVKLEVSIDGGSWSEFASVSGSATSASYTQASADHSYRFRARGYYKSSYSSYTSATASISMTPSAPQSISVAASGGTNVTVTLSNASPVATSLEYQTSTDGGSTWSASTTVSGSPVTSFSTSVSGTALIRVRNKNATGVSDWLVSDPITTICPPAPPTLRTPSGSVYDMAQGDIEFSWLHNSLDGSAQSAYELRYSINGGAYTTLSGTTEQSRTVSIGTFTAGDSVTWQVRTKGADASYSDWSQTQTFSVYTAPTVSITSPGATITSMPISLAATYSDMAGFTCVAATVSLTKDGSTLFSEAATISGTGITSSLDVSEFLPTNGESYTVVVTARSSSGLQTEANATFTVTFTEPVDGSLSISNDLENGYASLLATYDNTGADEPAVSISVARVNPDGSITPLITDGESGAGFEDKYAPLNVTYQYAVTTKASSQAVKTVYVDNIIESDYWFAYWGDNVAKAKWNPDNGGVQVSRPQKTRVYYAGRKDPVSYDGHAVALTESPSWTFVEKDEVDAFVKLIEDGGRGVYKSCDGWVYHADFDLTLNPSYTAIGYYGKAALTITRIAGERL